MMETRSAADRELKEWSTAGSEDMATSGGRAGIARTIEVESVWTPAWEGQ